MTINLKSDMMKRISLIFMLCITCLGLEAQETGRDRRVFNIDSSNGTVWVGTLRELMAYDTKNGNDSLYYQAGMDELDAFIGSIYCAADGNVWIGTWGKGARILKLDGQWTYNVHLSTRDYIMSMDGDGEYIWCGAAAKLIRLNADGSLSGSFSCGDKLSSTHSIVYDIDIDSQGRIWLSEENTGLSKVEDNRMEHMEDYENLPMRQGFLCHKIAVDEGNQCVWGVTDTRHGLHCYNLADASVTTYSQAEGTLPVETVWDVLVDRNGALWLASANGKLVKRQADGTFETFTAENLQNLGVLHEDDEGHIWWARKKATCWNSTGKSSSPTSICGPAPRRSRESPARPPTASKLWPEEAKSACNGRLTGARFSARISSTRTAGSSNPSTIPRKSKEVPGLPRRRSGAVVSTC